MPLDDVFCQALVGRFVRTRLSEEEIFGRAASAVKREPAGSKPRGTAGKFKAKTEALPRVVLNNILSRSELHNRAAQQQGFFTIKDYIETCAKGLDVSAGTFRRTFVKLVAEG